MSKIIISVITVSYNCISDLHTTICSVLSQTYDNIEFIIIDGNSNDGTKELLKKYDEELYYVSENDNGIYDAMNKGIVKSTGEWLIFMNAGDVFYNCNVIEEIFSNKYKNRNSIIYGDTLAIYNNMSVLRKSKNADLILFGMIACHQSIFFSRDIFTGNKYNLDYKITADFEILLKSYIRKVSFIKIDKIVSKIDAGGISNTKTHEVIKSYICILKENYSLGVLNFTKLYKQLLYCSLRDLVINIIPKNIVEYIRKIKNMKSSTINEENK